MTDETLFRISRAKVTRAREQLQGLQAEFQRFSDSKPYTLGQEHDLETKEFILVYYPQARIPENWGIILGEIFHTLRSALDNAVHELTVKEQGSPLEKTEFPIFDDLAKFFAVKKNSDPAPTSGIFRIRGLSQNTRNCIEALQPYHITQPDKVSVLTVLHELNIVDKHREGFLCRQLAQSTKLELIRDAAGFVSWGFDSIGGNLDERAVIARLKLASGLADEVYMDAQLVIDIAFDQRCCSAFKKNEAVVGMTAFVINGVEEILSRLRKTVS